MKINFTIESDEIGAIYEEMELSQGTLTPEQMQAVLDTVECDSVLADGIHDAIVDAIHGLFE